MIQDNVSFFRQLCNRKTFLLLIVNSMSAIPYYLTGSTLSIYLNEMNFSLSAIGSIALLNTPQAIKFLWSHIFDSVSVPYLSKKIGLRRSWMFLCQVIIIASLLCISSLDPRLSPYMFFVTIIIINFCVASYNILALAFQMELFAKHSWGIGEAVNVIGFRGGGALISGAGAILLSTYFSWGFVYKIIALCMIPALILISFISVDSALISEPINNDEDENDINNSTNQDTPLGNQVKKNTKTTKKLTKNTWIYSFILSFKGLFDKKGSFILFIFMLAYMLYDNMLSNLPKIFHLSLGFSKVEVAWVDNIFGMIMILCGGFVAGVLIRYFGYIAILRAGSFLSVLVGLSFLLQMKMGNNIHALYFTVGVQEFIHGFTITSFVTFQMSCCSIRSAVSQLALLNSISSLGKYMFGSIAGILADFLGWYKFFILISIITIPSIILANLLSHYFVSDSKTEKVV